MSNLLEIMGSVGGAIALLDRLAENPKMRKVKGNPRGRSKGAITRKSQATKKPPTKRLIARRKKTLSAPKGFFANPVHAYKHAIQVAGPGSRPGSPNWRTVGVFKSREEAMAFGRAYADKNRETVGYKKLP